MCIQRLIILIRLSLSGHIISIINVNWVTSLQMTSLIFKIHASSHLSEFSLAISVSMLNFFPDILSRDELNIKSNLGSSVMGF